MKVELLILISDDDTFCNSTKSFIDFIKIDSLISISNDRVSYKKDPHKPISVSAKIRVETKKVKSNNERYFLVQLECEKSENIDNFSDLIDRLKTTAERISPGTTTINTLWDDIGRVYAEKAYPIINETENLMRRLIAKFMLITVGMKWSKDAIHPDLFLKIENFEDEEPYINDLHKLDFIHLSQVLFEKKRDISLEELDRLLLKTTFNKEDTDRISKYIPRSNWEKHFSSLVDEKDHSLEKKWSLLYKLRNKVAHNRSVKKTEFEKIRGLSSNIKDIITKATEKLGDIIINQEDRDLILHSYHSDPYYATRAIGEQAVFHHYSSLRYKLQIASTNDPADNIPFDFIAIGYEGTIGVETTITSFSNITRKTFFIVSKLKSTWLKYKQSKQLDKVHVVCILTDSTEDTPIANAAPLLESVLSNLDDLIEIHIYRLDEANNLIPILKINSSDSITKPDNKEVD